jgi:sugar lactone lactonase YvrE
VVRVDVDTGTVTLVADGFGSPEAVKFDSQGRLYVADYVKGEVSRVDAETGSKEVIATGLSGLDNIAFDSQDRLFVSRAQEGSIFEVLPNGTTRTVSPGGMIGPEGIAVLPRAGGGVYVGNDQAGATGCQQLCDRQAYAGGAPRDNGNLTLRVHVPSSRIRFGRAR